MQLFKGKSNERHVEETLKFHKLLIISRNKV